MSVTPAAAYRPTVSSNASTDDEPGVEQRAGEHQAVERRRVTRQRRRTLRRAEPSARAPPSTLAPVPGGPGCAHVADGDPHLAEGAPPAASPAPAAAGHGEGHAGSLHAAGVGCVLRRPSSSAPGTTSAGSRSRRSSTSTNSAKRSALAADRPGRCAEHGGVPPGASGADAEREAATRESSNVTTSLAKGTGWRKLGETTRVPSRMRSVARAAAVSAGTAANQGESRSDRQARWSYVQAWSNPSASARRHNACACGHRCSGRMTTPNRITGTLFAGRGAVGRLGAVPSGASTRCRRRLGAVPSGASARCRRAPRARCRRAPRRGASGASGRGAVGRLGARCPGASGRGAVGRLGARCRRAPRGAVPSGASGRGAVGPEPSGRFVLSSGRGLASCGGDRRPRPRRTRDGSGLGPPARRARRAPTSWPWRCPDSAAPALPGSVPPRRTTSRGSWASWRPRRRRADRSRGPRLGRRLRDPRGEHCGPSWCARG